MDTSLRSMFANCTLLLLSVTATTKVSCLTTCYAANSSGAHATCNVGYNDTVCVLCLIPRMEKCFGWFLDGERIFRNENPVGETTTKELHSTGCNNETYSLQISNAGSIYGRWYSCQDCYSHLIYNVSIQTRVKPILVVTNDGQPVKDILKTLYGNKLKFQCDIHEAVKPFKMAWYLNNIEKKSFELNATNATYRHLKIFSTSIEVTVNKDISKLSCKCSGRFIFDSSLDIHIHGEEMDKIVSTTTDRKDIGMKDLHDNKMNDDEIDTRIYSYPFENEKEDLNQDINSGGPNFHLKDVVKIKGAFEYWRGFFRNNSSEEKECFAKTLSDQATVEIVRNFQELARSLQLLKKSNFVVEVLGVSTEKLPYVMYFEYVEYGTLRDFLLQRYQQPVCTTDPASYNMNASPVSLGRATLELLNFALMVTEAMLFINSQKFSHPVLSLRKVLLSAGCNCKLYDIYPTEVAMTKINILIKKEIPPIAWMAPETLFLQEYSPESDVWSYAVTLWELFSVGKVPYAGLSSSDIEVKVREDWVLPQTLSCPGSIYEIMLSCWNKSARSRPALEETLHKIHAALGSHSQE